MSDPTNRLEERYELFVDRLHQRIIDALNADDIGGHTDADMRERYRKAMRELGQMVDELLDAEEVKKASVDLHLTEGEWERIDRLVRLYSDVYGHLGGPAPENPLRCMLLLGEGLAEHIKRRDGRLGPLPPVLVRTD